jgi:AMP phosphorylase
VGPLLEARDSLKVLEQSKDRPMELEYLAIEIARLLLDLCLEEANSEITDNFKNKYKNTHEWAADILWSGLALKKFKEIISAQGGDPEIRSKDLHPAKYCTSVRSEKAGKISLVSSKNITTIAKILGAPEDRKSGIFLNKRLNEKTEKDEELFMMYSESEYQLKEAKDSLDIFPIFEIEK